MAVNVHQRISLQPMYHDGFAPVGLLLQQDEYHDLVEKWSLTSTLYGSLRQTIFKVSAGHVGAIVDFMIFIKQSDVCAFACSAHRKLECDSLLGIPSNEEHQEQVYHT